MILGYCSKHIPSQLTNKDVGSLVSYRWMKSIKWMLKCNGVIHQSLKGKWWNLIFFFLEVDLFFLNLRHLFRDVLYCYNRIPQTEQFTMNRNLLADGSGGREDWGLASNENFLSISSYGRKWKGRRASCQTCVFLALLQTVSICSWRWSSCDLNTSH